MLSWLSVARPSRWWLAVEGRAHRSHQPTAAPTRKPGATGQQHNEAGHPNKDSGSKDTGGGSEDTGGGSSDTGTSKDTGTSTDTGTSSDTGTSNDTGTSHDTGTSVKDTGVDTGGAICGNGIREGNEQCDDGNVINLDGCDSDCRFEQNQRITGLAIQNGTAAPLCPHNALGAAASAALSTLNGDLTTSIKSGSLSILFAFVNPTTDLTGDNDPKVSVGPINGTLTDAYTGAANGTADIDWWYTADTTQLSAARVPLSLLPGVITNHVLTVGPASLSLPLNLGGAPAVLDLTNASIQATLGTADAPTISAGATPPGHKTSENLLPSLTSFETGGGTSAAPSGELCGDVTSASLAQIAVPATLATGGGTACSQGYSATLPTNSLLDVFVHGCTVDGLLPVITPTQPDQPGGYTLGLTGNHVTSCKQGNTTVALATCLAATSYSVYLKFSSDRVIIH